MKSRMAPTTGPPKVLGLSDKGPGPGWSLRRRGTWSLAEMLGAHPNSRCGMKQLAMAGSALGVGGWAEGAGRGQLPEGQSSPSRGLAVISHRLCCQGEGLGAPPWDWGSCRRRQIPGDQHSDGSPRTGRQPSLGQQCGFGQPCSPGPCDSPHPPTSGPRLPPGPQEGWELCWDNCPPPPRGQRESKAI